mgnify:CR=1 FL=1
MFGLWRTPKIDGLWIEWCLNEETFSEIVGERAPWWSPPAINDRVTHRLHLELVAWIAEIFPDARQREKALGYTQAFSSLGGQMVATANGFVT